MGRPRLDSSDETIKVSIRLTHADLDTLDRRRGPATRSAYLRKLIRGPAASSNSHPQPLPGPNTHTTTPEPPAVHAPAPKRHLHRFVNTDQVVGYHLGTTNPIYRRVCDCGEFRDT